MADHNILGKEGEKYALQYLKDAGYSILESNWRFRKFEVDIIARIGEEICFVEVKTRSQNDQGMDEVISSQKESNLIEAADAYMKELKEDLECRIDLISVQKKKQGFNVTHIENAITPES